LRANIERNNTMNKIKQPFCKLTRCPLTGRRYCHYTPRRGPQGTPTADTCLHFQTHRKAYHCAFHTDMNQLRADSKQLHHLIANGIVLIDVYGDRDVILATPASPQLDGLIDIWKELDNLYCETGEEGDWQPIQDWLSANGIQLLKLYWKTL
jgi:hypothetical protein